jgi:hypothetical protein
VAEKIYTFHVGFRTTDEEGNNEQLVGQERPIAADSVGELVELVRSDYQRLKEQADKDDAWLFIDTGEVIRNSDSASDMDDSSIPQREDVGEELIQRLDE